MGNVMTTTGIFKVMKEIKVIRQKNYCRKVQRLEVS